LRRTLVEIHRELTSMPGYASVTPALEWSMEEAVRATEIVPLGQVAVSREKQEKMIRITIR
jgi:hypothetical protein